MIRSSPGNVRFRNLAFVCIMVLCPLFLSAQETAPADTANRQAASAAYTLTIEDAVQMAIENNLSIQASGIELGTKRRASDYSWNQFIPNVTIAGSFMVDNEATTNSGVVPVTEMPLNMLSPVPLPPGTPNIYGVVPYSIDIPQWRIAGSVQASVTVNAAMFENMKRLRLDYEGGLITYEKARVQLERDVRKA